MEDASNVIGEELPGLINRMKNSELVDPPQFLTNILSPLKEGAYNEDGDFDSRRLYLLAGREIGSMCTNELSGGQINDKERMVLGIIRVVAPLCRLEPIPRPKDSEQKCQNVWERILNILFEGTRTSVEIGETGLEPSKAERAINEAAHTAASTPVAARKVDCKLVASVVKSKKWEFKPLSNFELKPGKASLSQVEIQVRKNMRLNHSILKKLPSSRQYFLDIH
ncbi:hypothetical protein BGZ46_005470, partial [Entomortierella lignicola]